MDGWKKRCKQQKKRARYSLTVCRDAAHLRQFDKTGISGGGAIAFFPAMLAAHLAWSAAIPAATFLLARPLAIEKT
jgi:hypothetical protein